VEQGAMDRAGALWYAGRILRENAREFFPL